MHPDQDPSEKLLKLLVIKRYEQPPPGFYNRFSSGVLTRLESAKPAAAPSLWQRMFEAVLDRSIVVGAYGCLVVAMVVTGLKVAGYYEGSEVGTSAEAHMPMATAVIPENPIQNSLSVGSDWLAQAGRRPSFNPVIPTRAPSFLFNPNGVQGSARHPMLQEASYTVQP
jgi:hypothetical protein